MPTPWLSVIIPTYNGEAYLSSAMDSILTQGDSDIEAIVVDAGSTDATPSILQAYQHRLPLTLLQRPPRPANHPLAEEFSSSEALRARQSR